MKKTRLLAVILLILGIVSPSDPVVAASLPFFELDRTSYSVGEIINLSVYNAEFVPEKQVEIVWNDTGEIVYRANFKVAQTSIPVPVLGGDYTMNIILGPEYLSKRFTVIGNQKNNCALVSHYVQNLEQQVIGVRLDWQEFTDTKDYTVIRMQKDGEIRTYDSINVNHWIDVNLEPNTTYTYYVTDGETISNTVIVDLPEFVPSEYYKNNNTGIIELDVGNPYMIVNGNAAQIDPSDIGIVPVIIEDRVMLPIRALVEAMGGSVGWDAVSRTVTLDAWGQKVEVPIGKQTIRVNGQERHFDVPAQIERNRTLVPVRHLEMLGCEVEWINETRSVLICYQE